MLWDLIGFLYIMVDHYYRGKVYNQGETLSVIDYYLLYIVHIVRCW